MRTTRTCAGAGDRVRPDGPYRRRPGFGTLAEAMSGFAAATGEVDGPPTLPPFGLADGIASLATAYAIMVALHARAATGRGQVIDLAIVEPIMTMLGPQITRWDQLGTLQPRTGNRSSNNAPRNTYRTGDGHWVAVSTSSQSIAERLLQLVGRPDLVDQRGSPRGGPGEHADERTRRWGRGSRPDAGRGNGAFERAEAAVAPVYTAEDSWPTALQAIGTIHRIDDPSSADGHAGSTVRMSETPPGIRHTGRAAGRRHRPFCAGWL